MSKIKKVLKQLKERLDDKICWAIFGSNAVAIHKGSLHRKIDDLDVIAENNKQKICDAFSDIGVCFRKRNNRDRGYLKIDGIKIELMLLSGDREIDLADGKFSFREIEEKEFNGETFPVIDLQSLYCAKLRHKQELEKAENKKLTNTKRDIDVLRELLKNHRLQSPPH